MGANLARGPAGPGAEEGDKWNCVIPAPLRSRLQGFRINYKRII